MSVRQFIFLSVKHSSLCMWNRDQYFFRSLFFLYRLHRLKIIDVTSCTWQCYMLYWQNIVVQYDCVMRVYDVNMTSITLRFEIHLFFSLFFSCIYCISGIECNWIIHFTIPYTMGFKSDFLLYLRHFLWKLLHAKASHFDKILKFYYLFSMHLNALDA